MIDENKIREAVTIILGVASKMVTTGISECIEEYDLPKSTSASIKKKIIDTAEKYNEYNRFRATHLKNAVDILINELNKKP